MTTASDNIMIQGLSLADAHLIADELRTRTAGLREQHCEWTKVLQDCDPDNLNAISGCEAILSALMFERGKTLAAREALSAAIAQTFNNLG